MSSPALAYAKCVHRLAVMVGDGSDPDENPDVVYADGGTVTLTPTIGSVHVTMPDGSTLVLAPQAITCTVDANGYMSWNGQPWVWVLDLGDSSVNPSISRSAAAYMVSYANLTAGGKSFILNSFGVNPDSSEVVNDLGAMSPLPSGSGTSIVQGPPGPAGATGEQGPAGEGVPVGGTTGQVLTKASDTDYDTDWTTVSGGGGGSAGLYVPTRKSGLWYTPPGNASSAVTINQNAEYAFPWNVGPGESITNLAVSVSTSFAGITYRLGIRADDNGGQPGTLILDAQAASGPIYGDTTGYKQLPSPISYTNSSSSAVRVWIVIVAQGGTGHLYGLTYGAGTFADQIGTASANQQSGAVAYTGGSESGALTSAAPTYADSSATPQIWIKN